jgi:hypothetical protein
MSFYLYFNILHNHPHHISKWMSTIYIFYLKKTWWKVWTFRPIYLCKNPLYIFYFIFSRFLKFFPTRPPTWNTLILWHPVYFIFRSECFIKTEKLTFLSKTFIHTSKKCDILSMGNKETDWFTSWWPWKLASEFFNKLSYHFLTSSLFSLEFPRCMNKS